MSNGAGSEERTASGARHNRREKAKRVGAALALALLPGCATATLVDGRYRAGAEHLIWAHLFVFGAVGETDVDVRRVCGTEAARVRTGGDVGTALIAIATLGIYTPRKVSVTCATP
jgi:hypothetical protein